MRPRGTVSIALSSFDAFLFDLDGVITRTAGLQASAWKRLFDEYLTAEAARRRTAFVPFDIVSDYRVHVGGKPRHAGVRDFLASRGVRLPEGAPQDEPGQDTVHGLGKRKNRYFIAALQQERVRVYQSAVALVREARARGIKTAVVSSSRNTAAILRVARLTDLFHVRVDGVEVVRLGLPGTRYRGQSLTVELERDAVNVRAMHCVAPSIRVAIDGKIHDVCASETRRFSLE